jgi:hypothetical protein
MREATTKIVVSTTMRARSTRRVLEMPRRLYPNVPTTTPQATRQRRPLLLLLLQSLGKKIRNLSTGIAFGIADESVTMLEDHHSYPPPVALLLGRPSSCGVYFVLE